MTGSHATDALRVHGKSFHFAGRFLGRVDADRGARLYHICRRIDDLADESCDRQALLALRRAIVNSDQSEPLFADYMALDAGMPVSPLVDLVDGVLSDLDEVALASVEDLEQYAYRVAGTVGLMMCHVFGVTDEHAFDHAIALGKAMQLTNIARDLVTDATMGRRYMPAEWVGQLSPDTVLRPTDSDRLLLRRGLVRMLNRADELYLEGFAGLKYLPARPRLAIAVAARVYREIGVRIRLRGLDPWSGRVVVPISKKAQIAIDCLLRRSGQPVLVSA